jgi:hypothetical protein
MSGYDDIARDIEAVLNADYRESISRRLNEHWASWQRFENDREEAEAKADPVRHKLSKLFDNSNYRYYRSKDGRGREVRFCYSCHRNVAGYFLAWREVIGKKEAKRDGWIANRRKQTLIDRQRKLAKQSRDPR